MELRRCYYRMITIVFIWVTYFSGVENEEAHMYNLHCYNDFDKLMTCTFRPTTDRPNCTDYSLNSRDVAGVTTQLHCYLKQDHECSCSAEMLIIFMEDHYTTLEISGRQLASIVTNVDKNIKPKAPTITSVKQSKNGNVLVTWNIHYTTITITDHLITTVTYQKLGQTDEVSRNTTSYSLEILHKDLESNTEYVVSVKSYLDFTGLYSDSSEQFNFTTAASPSMGLLAKTLGLSVYAIIVSCVVFFCFVRYKDKWWDEAVKNTKPNILNVVPVKEKFIHFSEPKYSPIYIGYLQNNLKCGEPCPIYPVMDTSSGSYEQSNKTTTKSSSLVYANHLSIDTNAQKALGIVIPHMTPIPSQIKSGLPVSLDNNSSIAPSVFQNMSYSFVIPSCRRQIILDERQPVMSCDDDYKPVDQSVILPNSCSDSQRPFQCLNTEPKCMLQLAASKIETDLSYQPCSVDSGNCSSSEEPSTVSMNSSASFNPSAETGCKTFHETKRDSGTELECSPACVFPPIDDDYQAFHSLVQQSDMFTPGQGGGQGDKQLDKNPNECFSVTPLSSLEQVRQWHSEGGHSVFTLPTVQSKPMLMESGYQMV